MPLEMDSRGNRAFVLNRAAAKFERLEKVRLFEIHKSEAFLFVNFPSKYCACTEVMLLF